MKAGERDMKLLKIENSLGEYSLDKGQSWQCITKITKEDLFNLADCILENEVVFDIYSEGLISNKANEIMYSIIYKKLNQLSDDKVKLIDEINNLYKDAFEKYSI